MNLEQWDDSENRPASSTPPLRGVQVYDCRACRGRGHRFRRTCPDCQGRRVIIIQHGHVVKLTSTPKRIEDEPKRVDRRPGLTTVQQRLADGQCRYCGSPATNGTECIPCSEKRSSTRRASGEIG